MALSDLYFTLELQNIARISIGGKRYWEGDIKKSDKGNDGMNWYTENGKDLIKILFGWREFSAKWVVVEIWGTWGRDINFDKEMMT